jgi:rhodanese-related sulfurtransferase
MRVADDHGLNSWFVSNASVKMLRQHNGPALLRIREPSGTAGHWVVLSRFDEQGRAVIVDLPEREVLLDESDLLTYWDSQAILLGNTPIDSRLIVRGRFEQLLPAFLVIVLLVAARLMGSSVIRRGWQFQFLALVGMGFGLAVVWQFASPISYLNNPDPVRFVTSSSLEPNKIIYQLPESLDSFQLIDCRMSPDYNSGTFGNAINLPINSRFAAFRRITESLSAETPVIVFCQSSQCDWADTVATKLSALGFSDVSVYRPGFVGMAPRLEEK